jgi:hypothetical protein
MVIDDHAAAVDPTAGFQVAPLPFAPPAPRVEQFAPPVNARVRHGHRWWTASLTLAVLVTAGGLALLYNDEITAQNANQALTTANESLQGQNLGLQGELTATKGDLSTAQADLVAARAELAHPTLGIWNIRQTLQGPSYYLAAGIPDTFTYHLKLKSTGPMNVSILSIEQFSSAITCINNGVGPTNWCMHHSGAAKGWLGVTSVTYDYHVAEGCAGYLLVITAPGVVTVTPDVSVTYNPASHATGTCA